MQKIQNDKIKESVYIETLENGMKIMVIPKPNTNKKYIIWATKFGSIDNHFIEPKTGKEIKVPDGVAHCGVGSADHCRIGQGGRN